MLTSEGPAREFRGEQEVHYRSTRTLDRPRDTTRLRSRLGDTPGIAVSPDRRVEILILDRSRLEADDILWHDRGMIKS